MASGNRALYYIPAGARLSPCSLSSWPRSPGVARRPVLMCDPRARVTRRLLGARPEADWCALFNIRLRNANEINALQLECAVHSSPSRNQCEINSIRVRAESSSATGLRCERNPGPPIVLDHHFVAVAARARTSKRGHKQTIKI